MSVIEKRVEGSSTSVRRACTTGASTPPSGRGEGSHDVIFICPECGQRYDITGRFASEHSKSKIERVRR